MPVPFDTYGCRFYKKESNNIIKHSKNIIDLIEEGDIVNGDLLVYKGKTANETEKLLVGNHIIRGMALEIVDIKKVVTKEQFASIEYKVEAEVKENENRGN